ncbi:MAG TPA: hypothetical protein VIW64_07165 [Pyrinomonadaceae bacterium]|jgi:hypothetical protein
MNWLSQLVHDPSRISKFCAVYIISYYFVSGFSIRAAKAIAASPPKAAKAWWRKNRPLDIVTSVTWLAFAILLIWSLSTLAFSASLTLRDLIQYYFLFIFLFAFCYGILDWHWGDMLEGVQHDSWQALAEHILISIQTQTTIGYTRGRPKRLIVDFIACLQALLGIFLITISIARAVNKQY